MKLTNIAGATDDQLIARFIEIGALQGDALLDNATAKYNSLYDEKSAILAELKGRPGDRRNLLVRLLNHPNMQVRLNAVHATLAVAPKEAKRVLEAIAASKHFPQAGYAGMSLTNLERGIYKPA